MEQLKSSNEILDLIRKISYDLSLIQKGDTLSSLWPFINNESEYYLGETFLKDLISTMKIIENKLSYEEIAILLGFPSKVTQYLTYIHSLKKINYEDRIYFLNFIIKLLKIYKKDYLSNKNTNQLNDKFIKLHIDELKIEKNEDEINKIKIINSLLLLYLETIYPTLMRLGYEIHGPYQINNSKFIIKEFYDINGSEINSMKENIEKKINKIRIIEEIKGEVLLDIFNHVIKSPKVIGVYIECNDKYISKSEYDFLINKIDKMINYRSEECKNYSKKDWLKSFGNNLYYSFRKIFQIANKDSFLPLEIEKKIDSNDYSFPIEKAIEFRDTHSLDEINNIIYSNLLKIVKEK